MEGGWETVVEGFKEFKAQQESTADDKNLTVLIEARFCNLGKHNHCIQMIGRHL